MRTDLEHRQRRVQTARTLALTLITALAAFVVIQSAYTAKRNGPGPALVAIDQDPTLRFDRPADGTTTSPALVQLETPAPAAVEPEQTAARVESLPGQEIVTLPGGYERYFDGRPIRPVKTIWMTVTAYSPDEHSCGDSADGYTATNHSVWTNSMKLVAADTRILPFGSMVSIPGYADGDVVPVLDRGGAIKGKRLDVLYPTHEIARKWGVRKLKVTIWEFADGKPGDLGHRKRG